MATEMEQAVIVREPDQLTANQVKAQRHLVDDVMKGVMVNGTHYGKIPGCGDKPTLLKPGAEKLASTFRLAINPEIEDMSTKDVVRYRIRAMISHQVSGAFLGAGVGECSSNEEKYCWRNAVCQEEFDDTPEDRRRIKYRSSYGKITKVNQVRTNPADIANTVLKMAKKRALVDGILTVCGASDIFTQDIEDMPDELIHQDKPAQVETKPAPKQAAPVPQPEPVEAPMPESETQTAGRLITDKQRKRMYAIARGRGMNDQQFKDEIIRFGYSSSADVPMDAYEDICSHFEQWTA